MHDNQPNLNGAITAISTALESMEKRQAEISTHLMTTKQRRREKLDERIAAHLPDITDETMKTLKQVAPSFASDIKVTDAFKQYRKQFWIFKPSGYDAALTLLQTQLRRYCEQSGVVNDEDQEIMKMESQKLTLAKQQTEALEMLRLLEKTKGTNAPLPPDAVTSINSLAQKGRGMGSASQTKQAAVHNNFYSGSSQSTYQSSTDSDSDLWLWMMTDIPTSFRTLMLNSFAHHDSNNHHLTTSVAPGGGDYAGAGASGDFTNTYAPVSRQVEPTGNYTEVSNISTDDSLGVFS